MSRPVQPPSAKTVQQREKQLYLGKQTREYCRYVRCVRKEDRNPAWKFDWHPVTPDAMKPCSSRAFHGLVGAWRRQLHLWGNLDDESYQHLFQHPGIYPPSLHPCAANNARFSVPPVYENSEVLTLYKSDKILSAAAFSAKQSSHLARLFIFNGIYASEKTPLKQNLPVAFLPKQFRSMQLWPECIFLKEEDLISQQQLQAHLLCRLQSLQQGRPLQILGRTISNIIIPTAYHSSSRISHQSFPVQPAAAKPPPPTRHLCSLADRVRLQQRTSMPTIESLNVMCLEGFLPYQHGYAHWRAFSSCVNRF